MKAIYLGLRKLKYCNFFFFNHMLYLADLFRPQLNLPEVGKVILNCGLPRSGTTVVQLMLELISGEKKEGAQKYVNTSREFNDALQEYDALCIIKTHRYFPALLRYCRSGQVIPVVAHRDLRDVAVSLRSRGWIANIFEAVKSYQFRHLAFSTLGYARVSTAVVISYEDIILNQSVVLSRLCKVLGVELSDDQRADILDKCSLDAVQKAVSESELSAGNNFSSWDPVTGLHNNHIQDPTIGKWKHNLTVREASLIHTQGREFQEEFGYLE